MTCLKKTLRLKVKYFTLVLSRSPIIERFQVPFCTTFYRNIFISCIFRKIKKYQLSLDWTKTFTPVTLISSSITILCWYFIGKVFPVLKRLESSLHEKVTLNFNFTCSVWFVCSNIDQCPVLTINQRPYWKERIYWYNTYLLLGWLF